MKKFLIPVVFVVFSLISWYLLRGADAASNPDQQASLAQTMPNSTSLPKDEGKSASVAHEPDLTIPLPGANMPAQKVLNEIALDRRLPNYQAINIENRNWAVLGSRQVENATGKQTVLVLRDELSGQLAYRQSGLRFVLRDGLDYEAFIHERSRAKRVFANSLYAELAVDAADISAEYAALAKDERVIRLEFMPLNIPVTLK